ncbi:hypothetical protein CEXT_81281 [Caerostris extrusa]|uniref:Uncharacterized protein n=1 Tax=Caerostris extrusa TaxID=172846 RepID=A0AAV4VR14_CAEEX|nr:hypothetical protein CEXT_81281 [Caerostris extrusa]
MRKSCGSTTSGRRPEGYQEAPWPTTPSGPSPWPSTRQSVSSRPTTRQSKSSTTATIMSKQLYMAMNSTVFGSLVENDRDKCVGRTVSDCILREDMRLNSKWPESACTL